MRLASLVAAVHSILTNNLSKAWLSKVHAEKKAEEAIVEVRFEVGPWDGNVDLSLLKANAKGHELENLAQVTWLSAPWSRRWGTGSRSSSSSPALTRPLVPPLRSPPTTLRRPSRKKS